MPLSRGISILITTGIFPPDIGGPASYVPSIATALQERDHRIQVVTLADDPDQESDHSFPVERVARGQNLALRIAKTARLIGRLASDADVIYANGLRIETMMAAARTRTPVVHKIVGDSAWERARNRRWFAGSLDAFQRASDLRSRILRGIRTKPLSHTAGVIVPSRYLRRLVIDWGVHPDRVHVVYNAFQPLVTSSDAADLPGFDGQTLITVSRLVPWKRVDQLIGLVQSLEGVRLIVVGDGPLREGLERQAADLPGRVHFTGSVDRRRVSALLKGADLFVLNSTYEGLPHVVLEAMHAGTPVVATDAGGTGEVVRNESTGLLVDVGDPHAMRRAVVDLLAHPGKRRQLAEAASELVRQEFDAERMVDATEEILRRASRRR